MSSITDETLLAALGHDSAAFEAFYRRHVGQVSRFLARRCWTPEDLADAVAQTFVELIASAQRFDARRGNATAWLLGIASHCASAQHRARRQGVALAVSLSGQRLLDEDDYERLERQIDAARLAPALAAALASLGSRDRELLELVELDELSPAEAARVLGDQAAATRVRLSRARRRLRAALDEQVNLVPLPRVEGGRR